MSEADGLAAFIAARYDEAEALAKAAQSRHRSPWTWKAVGARDYLQELRDADGSFIAEFAGGADVRPDAVIHAASLDPAHRLADIALKRAILAEHYILWRHDTSEAYEEFSVVSIGGADKDHGCVTCHYYGQGGVKGYGYCRTVRLLGTEFAGHPGYRAEWKP